MDIYDFDPSNVTLRIHSVEMTNFRNIEHSKVVFPNSNLDDLQARLPSVLGLYGQNGSGKTSVIMAIGLLKTLVSGEAVNSNFSSCIRRGCDRASLSYEFSIYKYTYINNDMSDIQQAILSDASNRAKYEVSYSFDIVKAETNEKNRPDAIVQIVNEQLSIKVIGKENSVILPKQVFVDTSDSVCNGKLQAFGSRSKYNLFTKGIKALQAELVEAKCLARSESRSFIFDPSVPDLIVVKYHQETKQSMQLELFQSVVFLFFNVVEKEMAHKDDGLSVDADVLIALNKIYDSDYKVPGYEYDKDRLFIVSSEERIKLLTDFFYCLLDDINNCNNLTIDAEALKSLDAGEFFIELSKIAETIETALSCKESDLFRYYFEVLWILVFTITSKLFIVDTSNIGEVNTNKTLPLIIKTAEDPERTFWTEYKTISLNMNGETEVEESCLEQIQKSVNQLSEVLSKIIPDLSLEISCCGNESIDDVIKRHNASNKEVMEQIMSKDLSEIMQSIMDTKEYNTNIEIIAIRDGNKIPLKYESDGIRRLISILSPLIGVYNDPAIMMAVDEIDSGIFEYLLGEILRIFATSSKGQLVFTSHNLRPLEVLPSKFLAFTTTNPKNRFTSIAKRGNSNLRETYFRNIVLGSKHDDIYRSTDPFEIEQAFIIAGE